MTRFKQFQTQNNWEIAKLFHNWKRKFIPLQYLCLNLSENSMKNIFLDQNDYISQLVKVSNIDNSTSIPDKMRSTEGKLLWISTQTRPDISFDVCQLANRIKSATENDLKCALKVIKHVQNDKVHIKYHNLHPKDNLHLVVYADASLAKLPDQ